MVVVGVVEDDCSPCGHRSGFGHGGNLPSLNGMIG